VCGWFRTAGGAGDRQVIKMCAHDTVCIHGEPRRVEIPPGVGKAGSDWTAASRSEVRVRFKKASQNMIG